MHGGREIERKGDERNSERANKEETIEREMDGVKRGRTEENKREREGERSLKIINSAPMLVEMLPNPKPDNDQISCRTCPNWQSQAS